jgi:Ca2+-binding RTX toxin-like protein
MANVIFRSPLPGLGMDFDNLQVFSAFFDYTNSFVNLSGNPDVIRLSDGPNDYTEITGTGFAGTVDGLGNLTSVTGGVLETFDVSIGGILALEASNIGAALPAAYNAAVANNTSLFLNILLGGNDTITGTAAADVLDGFKGNDKISGGNGDDEISGGLGRDILRGGNNDDDVFGGDGNDLVYGDAGIDRLYGNAGRDKFYGGTGNDQLISNADGVEDTFVFARNYDLDTIINYEEGIDTLALNDNIWGGGKTAAQVVADYATVNAGGTMITFDFGGGDILRVKAPTGVGGLDLVSIVNDITIL